MPITAWIISLLVLVLAPILLIRFRKRWVAAFNLAVTNRITSRFAARLPGFGILTHVGRKSGRLYRTPVNVFRAPEGFLIALTYGRESEWVRNVIAAGGCKLETRGVQYQLSAPTIVHADYLVPTGLQLGLGRIGFHTFRHTYRAWLDETGAPVGVQQKLMRHAHVSTTMDQYGNASALAKRKANRPIVQRLLRRPATQQISIQ